MEIEKGGDGERKVMEKERKWRKEGDGERKEMKKDLRC
jgi:hypothetical protein